MLDPALARTRQTRLLDVIQRRKLAAAVVGLTPNIYYLTAHLPFWLHHVGFVLFADGRSLLVCANEPATNAAADQIETYEASWAGTQRQEQPALVADRLIEALRGRLKSSQDPIAVDSSAVGGLVARGYGGNVQGIDEDLWQVRRQKDLDELALMKVAIECCRVMYERAGRIIEPGILETRVFAELHAAAVEVTGEPLSAHLGNDFACAAPGGPPRRGRTAKPSELYILDLGPAYRGYFSDNCRVFSVDHKPTDEQYKAWELILGVFPIVEKLARPGARCRDIYAAVDDYYRSSRGVPFPHHLGHGVGLQPHEFPHLNPKWDDVLLEGEVFTCEPGLYAPNLRAGLRLENQYLVTATGVENLTPFPLSLAP